MDTKNKLFTVIGSVALLATAGIGGATPFASKDDTASTTTGATNSISATVVVSGGTITSVTANDSYTDRESGMWIGDFESRLSSDASGQSLSSYNPSRIGGASLTTEAFSSVLDEIRSQAVV